MLERALIENFAYLLLTEMIWSSNFFPLNRLSNQAQLFHKTAKSYKFKSQKGKFVKLKVFINIMK